MVGALLESDREQIVAALQLGSTCQPDGRYRGWNAVPPRGLCLEHVFYPEDAA